ncbi:Uridylate kinase [Poriferisphaera corsica]|uniref:Uridylate kinase n=1 Tax=Poriferisphaera corsica TaxID=2528020 RepID=A0A517YRG0_9BACT|nr:UMP kinase [Poriferisphaera corsica]QDU32816.1 Uridylate kinase [Poriferisphaera corsica]
MTQPATSYKRVLLKISGEALCKSGSFGIDSDELKIIANEIVKAAKVGAQLGIVVGGGNIIRGATLAQEGAIQQATADQMGMLGTVMNGLALKEMLEKLGQPARVLSAINLSAVAETFIRGRAIRHLEKGRVVIFVAGTGNPFFTTDSAASLRAAEIGADVLLKATKVDGIYDKDPVKYPDATRYKHLTFSQAIDQDLKVMDLTAFDMCRKRNIPIIVFNMKQTDHIANVVAGKDHGTKVTVN